MSQDAVASMAPAANAVGTVRQCATTYHFPGAESGTNTVLLVQKVILLLNVKVQNASRFMDNALHWQAKI
jgi:hypothetical protein